MLFVITPHREWFTVSNECETIIQIEAYFEVVR